MSTAHEESFSGQTPFMAIPKTLRGEPSAHPTRGSWAESMGSRDGRCVDSLCCEAGLQSALQIVSRTVVGDSQIETQLRRSRLKSWFASEAVLDTAIAWSLLLGETFYVL